MKTFLNHANEDFSSNSLKAFITFQENISVNINPLSLFCCQTRWG